MNEIARYTTPSITYKPSMVEISNVDEIYLVIRQKGEERIRKDINDAIIDENGFTWFFSQEDTAKLNSRLGAAVQIDYLCGTARYTTKPRPYDITESAVDEVI